MRVDLLIQPKGGTAIVLFQRVKLKKALRMVKHMGNIEPEKLFTIRRSPETPTDEPIINND